MLRTQIALFAALFFSIASASPGDNLDEFKDCIYQCQQLTCFGNPYHIAQHEHHDYLRKRNYRFRRYEPSWLFDADVAPHLTWLFWDCKSNCDYQCQRIITQERVASGSEIVQFHGKWPFLRLLGVQELALALFSVANFVPHYLGFRQVSQALKAIPQNQAVLRWPLRNVQFMALVAMFAWFFSAIFHVRDFDVTEKLDYFFAGLTVLTGFYGVAFRYFGLYKPQRFIVACFFTLACISAYVAHVTRLLVDWLYTYNMRANIFVGVLQNAVWLLLCFSLYSRYYEQESSEKTIALTHLNYVSPKRVVLSSFYAKTAKHFSLYPLLLCGIVVLGMSLEIFDFPPFFFDLIDAHSLWHLVTVFPAFMGWYEWMIWDVRENIGSEMAAAAEKKQQ